MKDFNNVQEPAYKYETSVGKLLKIDEIKVNFKILKTQINKDGTCAIYLRLRKYDVLLSKDSTERQINSGIRVSPKSWSTKKNEVLKSDPDYINKNKILSQIQSKAYLKVH